MGRDFYGENIESEHLCCIFPTLFLIQLSSMESLAVPALRHAPRPMDCAVLRYGFNMKHDGNVIMCDSGERFEVLFFILNSKTLILKMIA